MLQKAIRLPKLISMPKGKSATGDWNFRVKRYVCPSCKRKGLYHTYTYESYRHRAAWVCMYNNCPSRLNHDTLWRKGDDKEVLEANPVLNENI